MAGMRGCVVICLLISYMYWGVHAQTDPLTKFSYSTFTSPLPGSGNFVANGALVLSQAGPLSTGSSAWYKDPIPVRGFSTSFIYTITNNTGSVNQRPDGIAFVIQGAGNDVVGSFGAGLGYGMSSTSGNGIRNSVAIEFDSWYNPELGDPNGFHISVHSDGANPNSADESKRIGQYVLYSNQFQLSVQEVVITYDPLQNGGTLSFVINNGAVQSVPNVSLEDLIGFDPALGTAYVGFTAGSHNGTGGAITETITVTNWAFTFLGAINAANTIVEGINATVAGDALSISVRAVDQYGNVMITDGVGSAGYVLSATLVQPDGTQQTSTASYSGSGKYVIIINATIAGNATVRVNLNNTIPVGGGTFNLVVAPSVPYAPLSYPYGFSLGVNSPGVAGVSGTCLVQLRDRFGNNITTDVDEVVQATITPLFTSSYSLVAVGVFSETLDLYVITYNVSLAGNFTLQVTVDDEATSDNSRTVQIVPATVEPTTSVVYGMGKTAVAGVQQYAYLQLKDIFGNNASNSNVDIFVQAFQGDVRVNGSVVSTDMGLCTISYTLTAASYNGQTYSLAVLVNNVPVVNSNSLIEVDPAPLSPTVSYAYGQGLSVSTAGEFGYFYVQLTDAFGNNQSVPLASVTTTISPSSGNSTTPIRVSLLDNGLYVYQYNVTVATTYSLSVMVNGEQVANGQSNVIVSPNVVSPPTCVSFGEGLSGNVEVGLNHVFYVQLRDAFQNNISTNGSEVLVVDISKHDNETYLYAQTVFNAGLYEVTYNITLAADFNITITVNDIPILNAAQNLTLFPGSIYPPQCVANNVAPGVIAGETNQVQVQLRDVYANDITEVTQPDGIVQATFKSSTGAANVDITYTGNGVYSLTYNATEAGSYTFAIQVNSTALLGGGQYAVKVQPAGAYGPNCKAEGAALTNSVAGENSTFAIYLFDVYNNLITSPVPSDAPAVVINTQSVSVVFNDDLGYYVASYNITTSAVYALTVTVDNTQIVVGSLSVTPAPLYVPNCLANGTSLSTSTAGNSGRFYVYQRDQFGNLIYDYSQVTTFEVIMTLNGIQYTLATANNGAGSYVVSYNMTIAGTYSTQVLVNGGNIFGSPFSTGINAAAFDPHGTITNGLSLNVVAGNLNIFTIQLKDIYGNNVTDADAPNPVTPGSIAVSLNNTYIDITTTLLPAGVIQVAYNYTRAGVYWMSVTINATEVGTSAPGWITIGPNDVYPLACTAAGDATSEAMVKKTNTFTLFVRDVYNNLRDFSPPSRLSVSLTANGLATVIGSPAPLVDGSYLVSYYIDEKVVYTMSVTFDNVHISGSPFSVDANYPNNSPPTAIIVGGVIGGIVVIALIIGGIWLYKRRRMEYVVLS